MRSMTRHSVASSMLRCCIGRQVAVENDQRRFVRGGFRANFVEFAAADQRGGIGGVAHLKNRAWQRRRPRCAPVRPIRRAIPGPVRRACARDALGALQCHADQQDAFGGCSVIVVSSSVQRGGSIRLDVCRAARRSSRSCDFAGIIRSGADAASVDDSWLTALVAQSTRG